MKTSEHLDQLIPALAKARLDFGTIERTKENPHFKFKYAPLEKILAAVDTPLAAQQLVLLGEISNTENMVTVTTRLMHSSEQWIESAVIVPMPGHLKDLQELGKAITYIRRYSISTMLNVQADDDADDHLGEEPQQERRAPRKGGQKLPVPAEDIAHLAPPRPTTAQIDALLHFLTEVYTEEEHGVSVIGQKLREAMGRTPDQKLTKRDIHAELTQAQYDQLKAEAEAALRHELNGSSDDDVPDFGPGSPVIDSTPPEVVDGHDDTTSAQEGESDAQESTLGPAPGNEVSDAGPGEDSVLYATPAAIKRVQTYAERHGLGALIIESLRHYPTPPGITKQRLMEIEANLKDRVEAQSATEA